MKEKETLKKLGLTEYESTIYLVLLNYGTSDVRTISTNCKVPKNKIYESLQNLLKQGLIEFLPTTPKRYTIKSLSGLDSLVKKKETEIKAVKDELSKIKIQSGNNIIHSEEIVLIDYGHQSFMTKIKEAIPKVKQENLILARKVRTDPVLLRLTKEAIKRGANVHLIVPKGDKSLINEWKKAGAKIRVLDNFPDITFSTFDDYLCRLNFDFKNQNDPTLWIENSVVIGILREYFFNLWEKSTPIK